MTRQETINTLMAKTEWFSASEIRTDWKRQGHVFGVINPDGTDLYPAYQFGADTQPLPVIRSVLEVFGPDVNPSTLVAWFHFPNGWLVLTDDPERRPQAPKDFLDDEAAVVVAARMHGTSYVA